MPRRSPAEYDWNSLRFDETILDRHFTAPRRRAIKFTVSHHMAIKGTGTGSALDACYRTWQSREASAHYGVDGELVRQFVWDGNAAWSTSDTEGNHAGISIEHANSATGDASQWPISEATLATGARLVAAIHRQHKLGRPTSNAAGTAGTMRQHRSFSSTACPGPFFRSAWERYVSMAQAAYDGGGAPPPPPTRFSDVPKSHPFYGQIEWMATSGISTGYADRTFRPAEPVLREQWAAFLFRLADPAGLADVPDTAGFRDEIAWLVGKGISQGYADRTFRPQVPVTRDAAAAMLYRLAGSPDFTPDKTAQAFADVRPDTTFYKEIEWLQFIGVTTGYPNPEPHGRPFFQPAEPLLREQAAVFLNRFANRRA